MLFVGCQWCQLIDDGKNEKKLSHEKSGKFFEIPLTFKTLLTSGTKVAQTVFDSRKSDN